MNKASLERIATLLRNYDEKLREKAEVYANMMADWADASQSETVKYAEMYTWVRTERMRVHDSLMELEFSIGKEQ